MLKLNLKLEIETLLEVEVSQHRSTTLVVR